MLMSMGHAATGGHVDVYDLLRAVIESVVHNVVGAVCMSWSVLSLDTTVRSVISVTAKNHVEVHDLYCC